ncbi:hypothetical protein B0H14DRAFT_3779595 [Mycena olivaceomarginata]|nr:hypothetical protein B0H14DRAFT_3779595 [Mycena olivaceomarginata]
MDLAKTSFSSFRKQWNKSKKAAVGIDTGIEDRTNRRLKRRKRKSAQLEKILVQYAAKAGIDLALLRDLINEQYLSDEVSGPEDDSDETMEEWVARLHAAAVAAKLPLSANARFLEILRPDWRSSQFSAIIHDLEKFRFDRLSVGVGRRSDRVPLYAPYDFGISQEWFDERSNEPEYRTLLKDWNHFPEPEGCGIDTWVPLANSPSRNPE